MSTSNGVAQTAARAEASINKAIIPVTKTVRDLASLLEDHRVLFVQENGVLVGSVTNGDFRRGIASGIPLGESVTRLMNRSPLAVREEDGYKVRLEKVSRLPAGLRYLPVLKNNGEIVRIVSDKCLMTLPNIAVLMAGGLGSRLKALTASTPKPMLKIAGKPILQLILEQLHLAGVSRFVISVNFKAEVIKEYFQDGSSFDVQISYVEETERLGTAGCLSLLAPSPNESFFVMNGDILTDLDPHELLERHRAVGAAATVCLHQYQMSVPYGVLQAADGRIQAIEEKPKASYNINAGIYVMDPQCLTLVPAGQMFDMTSLVERILAKGLPVGAYPLPGFWIDVGNVEDFQRANDEYHDGVNHNVWSRM
jgi:dTDP-glucose pyrophosphorylase/CBS domain-containing protein